MHRDDIALRYLAGTGRGLGSKQYATEPHDRGFTRDDAIEAVCQVFRVPRGAARLFVVSHPAWAAGPPAEEPGGSIDFTL
jgi:hypothetical protein